MNSFMFDVETLGVHSSDSIVLSAALIPFELAVSPTYEEIMNAGIFVKFDVMEQRTKYKRVMDKPTMKWWSEQDGPVKEKSFIPDSSRDLPLLTGIECIMKFVENRGGVKNAIFWARGGLDQVMLDSICRSAGMEPFIDYWNWMDVRTFINCMCPDASKGYCRVKYTPGFNRNMVVKHDPVHDCAYDIAMMQSYLPFEPTNK